MSSPQPTNTKHKFLVNPRFIEPPRPGIDSYSKIELIAWFKDNAQRMQGRVQSRTKDALQLCEDLVLQEQKDFFVWDDLVKGAEMKFLLDSFPIQRPAVDICCGYGFWIGKTLQGIDVGVDLYPDQGTDLYRRPIEGFPEKGFSRDTYHSVLQSDITKEIPLPEGFFKTAICICALEHIEDSQGALREIYRLVDPNEGRLLLTVQPKAFMQTYIDTFQPTYVQDIRDKHGMVCDRDPFEWRRLLEDQGFHVQKQLGRMSRELTLLYALTFYPHGLDPIIRLCPFEVAYRESSDFREEYRKRMSIWTSQDVALEEAGLLLFECVKKG